MVSLPGPGVCLVRLASRRPVAVVLAAVEVAVELEVAAGAPARSRVAVLSPSRAVELACGDDAVGLVVSPTGTWGVLRSPWRLARS